ncbi:MAG: adenylyl-sulfate kinase [Thermonemataceae bacterium]|nr:adenylyl-sulfate kinase [Thermonemataceae bacterium]
MISENIYPINCHSKADKEALLKQKGIVIWLMGLSGAGKSTLGTHLAERLYQKGFLTQCLDGDNLRSGLNKNLGFSEDDRLENIRRAAEVAKILADSGVIVIASFICPTHKTQKMVREIIGNQDFIEIFVNCPLEVCEQRDVKGLYAKARAGIIKDFTGIDSPFEAPIRPDFVIETHTENLESSLQKVYDFISPYIFYAS